MAIILPVHRLPHQLRPHLPIHCQISAFTLNCAFIISYSSLWRPLSFSIPTINQWLWSVIVVYDLWLPPIQLSWWFARCPSSLFLLLRRKQYLVIGLLAFFLLLGERNSRWFDPSPAPFPLHLSIRLQGNILLISHLLYEGTLDYWHISHLS